MQWMLCAPTLGAEQTGLVRPCRKDNASCGLWSRVVTSQTFYLPESLIRGKLLGKLGASTLLFMHRRCGILLRSLVVQCEGLWFAVLGVMSSILQLAKGFILLLTIS